MEDIKKEINEGLKENKTYEFEGEVGLAVLKIRDNSDIGNIPIYSKLLRKGGAMLVLSNEDDLGYVADDLILEGLDYKRLLVNVPKTEVENKLYNKGKTYISWAINVSKSSKAEERWIFNKPEELTFHTGAFFHDTDEDLYKELLELHTNEDSIVVTNDKLFEEESEAKNLETYFVKENVEYEKSRHELIPQDVDHPRFEVKEDEIMKEDCFDLLNNIKPESVDLVLTDPPYNISIEGSGEAYGNGRHGMDFGCVTEDVKINVGDEVKTYDELKVGDIVLTYNDNTGVFENNEVEKINVYDIKEEIDYYYVEGKLLGFTKNHRHVQLLENGEVVVSEVDAKDFIGFKFVEGENVPVEYKYSKTMVYEGKVWCPTVKNGTWLAQKGDTTLITGNSWDKGFDTERWLNYIAPVVKKGGSIVIFNSYKNIGVMVKVLKEYGYTLKGIPFWLKTNPIPHHPDRRYVSSMEHAVWLVRDYGEDVDYTFNLPKESSYNSGVFRFSQHDKQGERFHTTQKPVKLFNELVAIHSNRGDLVLDTFMGSGTTAVCSQNLGRHFMGSELDDTYFELSTKRVVRNSRIPSTLWD